MNNEQNNELVYTIEEFATKLKVSKTTIYKLVKSEGFPKICIGRRILIPVNEVMLWFKREWNG